MIECLYNNLTLSKKKPYKEVEYINTQNPYNYLKERYGEYFCVYPTVTEFKNEIVGTVELFAPGIYVRKLIFCKNVYETTAKINNLLKEILSELFPTKDPQSQKINNPRLNNDVTNFDTKLFEKNNNEGNRVTEKQIIYLRKFKKEKCNSDDEILNSYIKTWSNISKYNVSDKKDLILSGKVIVDIFIEWCIEKSQYFDIDKEKLD